MGLVLAHGAAAGENATLQNELAALQGRWQYGGGGASGPGFEAASALIRGGRNSDEVGFNWKLYELEVSGNTFTFAATAAGKTTARINPMRTPKTIDLTDAKGRTWLGVYELNGDTLEILFSFNKTRPIPVRDYSGRLVPRSEYTTWSQSGYGHAEYTRAKK